MNSNARTILIYLSGFSILPLYLASSSTATAQLPIPVDEDGNSIVAAGSEVILTTSQLPVPVDEDGNPIVSADSEVVQSTAIDAQLPLLTITELEEFVGPIALYPDNLLAIVLPASTYPLQIVLAARFLDALESDSSLQPDESWDESVIALLNYPEVVQMMSENIQWTWQLGEAVVTQESDVLTAITSFRELAYAAGNLETDEFQTVTSSDDALVITQIDETVVYIPYYVPEEVIVYQSEPVYHYYPTAYPVYYYPYATGHHFLSDYFWGVTTAFTLGWSDHLLHVYHPSYSHHPYYGHSYHFDHHYRRPSIRAFNHYYVDNHYRSASNRHRDGSNWRPQINSGVRPHDRRYQDRDNPISIARAASNGRREGRGSNNNRGIRADQPVTSALSGNSTQASQGPSRRLRNRQGTDGNGGRLANAFSNSTSTVETNSSPDTDRERLRSSSDRVVANDSRRRGRAVNQQRGSNDSNAVRANTNQARNSSSNRGRRPTSVTRTSQDIGLSNRISPDSSAVSLNEAVAAAQTRNRETRPSTTRQTSTAQTRRRERLTSNSRASIPATSRNREIRQAPTRQFSAPLSQNQSVANSNNARSSAPTTTRAREIRQAPTRQQSVPRARNQSLGLSVGRSSASATTRTRETRQTRARAQSAPPTRSRSSASSNRRSSAPAPSRSTGSASRSVRSSSASRSTPSVSRGSNQNNRSRSRRREP